jgi:hypothetical protein
MIEPHYTKDDAYAKAGTLELPELLRYGVGRLKELAALRSPRYDLPADSFLEAAVADFARAAQVLALERAALECEKAAKGTGPDGKPNCVWESAYKHVTDDCAAAIRSLKEKM